MNSVPYQLSAHLSTARKPCHPERSLAMSEANCQTESKDPYHGNTARRNERNFRIAVRFFDEDEIEHRPVSSREAAAWESPARQCRVCAVNGESPVGTARRGTNRVMFALTLLLLSAIASFAQTSIKFPGTKSELTSPDGRWVLQNVDRDQEPHHSIFLKDKTTGKTKRISDYERGASVVWSPDSRHFALNDYAGSDFTETSILSVDETVPKIDVQDAIFRHDKRMRAHVTLVGWGHDYFGVVRWLDAQRAVVHHWGHNDEPPLGDFCVCYVYALTGTVEKCAHQPKGSDLETRCWKTAP